MHKEICLRIYVNRLFITAKTENNISTEQHGIIHNEIIGKHLKRRRRSIISDKE